MVFSNAVFLFIYLPIVIAGYYILRGAFRNYWLLLMSILFYSWNKPSFTIILLTSIALNYIGAIIIEKSKNEKHKKIILLTTIIGNLGILVYFKYFNFLLETFNTLFDKNINVFIINAFFATVKPIKFHVSKIILYVRKFVKKTEIIRCVFFTNAI